MRGWWRGRSRPDSAGAEAAYDGEWHPPRALPPRAPAASIPDEYDLVRDSQHVATLTLPFSAAKVGAFDGRAELPPSRPSQVGSPGAPSPTFELPPAVGLIRQHFRVEGSRIREAYLARRELLLLQKAQLTCDREEWEKRRREAQVAYESADGFVFEPRFRSLAAAREAPPREDTEGSEEGIRAKVGLSRNWHLSHALYWGSTFVLVGAEFPLSYSLAEHLIAETDEKWMQSVMRYVLAISVTAAFLISVKLCGTLFRRAQTLLQLGRDLENDAAERNRDAQEAVGSSSVGAQPVISRHGEVLRSAAFRAALALVLLLVLSVAAFELSEYRGELFANLADEEVATSILQGQQDALDTAIGGDVDEALLERLFLAILGLSLAAGIVLAWASTDPSRERRPEAGKAGHQQLRDEVDRSQKELAAVERLLASTDVALDGLDVRRVEAEERVASAMAASESAYWQANVAHRMFVLSEEFLRWLAQVTDVPAAPGLPSPPAPAAVPSVSIGSEESA